ncbi:hypothetical protein [Aliarcobacter skirrowii]|uniref:hypothetical protein n=1 Tax=Aliarcobacter skirrowii TaxID=28200 RepID=UPI002A36C6E6|nr:hypothetical protein [Aliarcobacter skirrowii]MDY0180050.1 hypothetical protein [Aliarcobacter skirrowii]
MELLLVILFIVLLVAIAVILNNIYQILKNKDNRSKSLINEDNFNKIINYQDSFEKKLGNIHKSIKNISKKPNKIKSQEISLIKFGSQLERYEGFLNQSKEFEKLEVIESLKLIQTEPQAIEDTKIFYLSEISELIFTNNLSFEDLFIEEDYFDSIKYIYFKFKNKKKISDGGDYKKYEIDVIFMSKDKEEIVLKYEYFDNSLEELLEKYKEFEYMSFDSISYYESLKKDSYRIILNDLQSYLDYVGKEYYNKNFISNNKIEKLLTEPYGEFYDNNWQISKKNFTYVEKYSETKKQKELENMLDNELLEYSLSILYDTFRFLYRENNNRFEAVKIIDSLIEKKYPLAYLVKAILLIDGEFVLKDYSEAKSLLKEAYNLGLCSPAILVWNENNLDKF